MPSTRAPDLVVVTPVETSDCTVYFVARVEAGKCVGCGQIFGRGVLAPGISNVSADIEAGPAEDGQRRGRLDRHCKIRSTGGAGEKRQRRERCG